ncbi:MAG: EamA family transporter [Acutalibacteraceae bacterium]
MWLVLACLSAVFAAVTSILAKIGIKNIPSNLTTALRTGVVLVFSWLMVLVTGEIGAVTDITPKALLFLALSGFATGFSWLCYFKALSLGEVNKVVPIDKSSTVLSIILAFIILGESVSLPKGIGAAIIFAGTLLMSITAKSEQSKSDKKYLPYACGSAMFAALTSILAKIGIEDVPSNTATAVRTIFVLIMAWFVVFKNKEQKGLKSIDKKSLLFIVASGITTGCSWLCYYGAIKMGEVSVVVPIDKLSILLTIFFGRVVFKEHLTKKSAIGLALITLGTLLMLVK